MSKRHLAALDEIAHYIFPTYTKDGEPFVPLWAALHLRDTAREALGLGTAPPPRRSSQEKAG